MGRKPTIPEIPFSDTRLSEIPFSTDPTKQILYRDKKTPGLILIVSMSKKTFRFQAHVRASKPINARIGEFPHMNVTRARIAAGKFREDVSQGINPLAKLKDEKATALLQSATLREARDVYVSDKVSANKMKYSTASSKYQYDFDLYARDLLDRPLNHLTGELVEQLIRKLRDEPGKHGKGRDTSLGIFLRSLGAVLRNANKRYSTPGKPLYPPDGLPTARVRDLDILKKSQPKQRALTTKELPIFFRYLYERSSFARPRAGQVSADYFIFALLTGARKDEAAKLEWKDVEDLQGDLNAVTVKFRDTKTHENRLIPIGPVLVDLLMRRKIMLGSGEKYVFPSTGKSGYFAEPKNLTNAFLKGHPNFTSFSIHDMRRTFSSHGRTEVMDPLVISTLDGHKTKGNTTEKHYTVLGEEISPILRDSINAIELALLKKCFYEELVVEFSSQQNKIQGGFKESV